MTRTARSMIFVGMVAGVMLQGGLCLGQDADRGTGENIMQPPRWAVMTGTDPGAARISMRPVKTTLEKLSALPRPGALPPRGRIMPVYRTSRVGVAEKTLWSVDAHIIEAQINADGDYHLVLRGASGQQMTCELPNPTMMPRPSPFTRQMMQARSALAARLHTKTTPQSCDVRAEVTGLGYYGHVRPGDGPLNGLQLHPIISVAFPK